MIVTDVLHLFNCFKCCYKLNGTNVMTLKVNGLYTGVVQCIWVFEGFYLLVICGCFVQCTDVVVIFFIKNYGICTLQHSFFI